MAQRQALGLLQDADVDVDAQAQADDLANERQHALARGHRDDGAELERDQADGARQRRFARGARRGVGRDDGVDDQLADVGDEGR